MTASTSNHPAPVRQRLIDEGRRLHYAIVEWGKKQGVMAYRVLTATDAYFEIYNPKTKTISHSFPERISAAIKANAEALTEYAAWTRECDAKWAASSKRTDAPGLGSVATHTKPTPERPR